MEKAFNFGADTLYRAFHKGRSYPEQRKHEKKLKLAREKAQALEQRPAQHPLRRINISQSDLSLSDPQRTQPSCSLFQKLPPEIRARIWEELLGRSVLCFGKIPEGSKHRRLLLPFGHRDTFSPSLDQKVSDVYDGSDSMLDLRVLRTCHAAYIESMPAVWSSNIIAVFSPFVLLNLHDYILLPSHFSQIRHLQFEWTYVENPEFLNGRYTADHDGKTWQQFWDLVAHMGLQSLKVNVGYIGPPDSEGDINTDWMKPMLQVKGVRNVSLVLEGLTRPSDGFQRKEQFEKEIIQTWASGA